MMRFRRPAWRALPEAERSAIRGKKPLKRYRPGKKIGRQSALFSLIATKATDC